MMASDYCVPSDSLPPILSSDKLCNSVPSVYVVGDQTQGLVHARQTPIQISTHLKHMHILLQQTDICNTQRDSTQARTKNRANLLKQ